MIRPNAGSAAGSSVGADTALVRAGDGRPVDRDGRVKPLGPERRRPPPSAVQGQADTIAKRLDHGLNGWGQSCAVGPGVPFRESAQPVPDQDGGIKRWICCPVRQPSRCLGGVGAGRPERRAGLRRRICTRGPPLPHPHRSKSVMPVSGSGHRMRPVKYLVLPRLGGSSDRAYALARGRARPLCARRATAVGPRAPRERPPYGIGPRPQRRRRPRPPNEHPRSP